MEPDLNQFESNTGYTFSDRSILINALTHKSYNYEKRDGNFPDNERLEFLGDAVLELIVSEYLMEVFPEESEGNLSRLRAAIVNESELANLARRLGIGGFLLLGRGEELTDGRDKPSIISSAYEALVAAIFRDGGFFEARRVVREHLAPLLKNITVLGRSFDYKTRLQEITQKLHQDVPKYSVIFAEGPDHQKEFHVALFINDAEVAQGRGRSKKEAEQDAASIALKGFLND